MLSQNDFQFGSGGVGSNTWTKLANVEDGKTADRGVIVKNIDNGGTVMLVNMEGNVDLNGTPDPKKSYKVKPGQQVSLEINRPDQVVVAGMGEGLDYTWYSR